MVLKDNLEVRISATFDGDTFPVLITKGEHDALMEAVEILEDLLEASERPTYRYAYIAALNRNLVLHDSLNRTMGALKDAQEKIKELHKEVERQQARGDELQDARNDYADRLRKVNGESIRANRAESERDAARAQVERMRGMAADATGEEILSLVREGFSVTVRPGFSADAVMVDVEKRGPDMIRHANTAALDLNAARSSLFPGLTYTIKRAAHVLRQAIRPTPPHTYADWVKANPGVYPSYPLPGTL